MDKFNRQYQLRIDASDGISTGVTVGLPFTLEFDIQRSTLSGSNIGKVRIYNLSLVNRNKIRRNIADVGPPFQNLQLLAGYGDDLTEIFSGNVSQAWSTRDGQNYITEVECFDGGFGYINGKTDRSVRAGTPHQAIISSLFNDLPYVKPGAIGGYNDITKRGTTLSGNTANILRERTGGGFFVDGGKAYALKDDEYIEDGSAVVVNAATGLLGTPILEKTIARFEMLFEPKLNVGRRVFVESTTESNFNGFYKIIEVKHRGMISAAVCGRVTTSAGFFFSKALKAVAGLGI